MKTIRPVLFLILIAILTTCAGFADNPDAKPRVTVTMRDGKAKDYKLDWIDEKKIVVFERTTLDAVTFQRNDVASISFGEDFSGKFRAGEEGFVLKNHTVMKGRPTSMDKDTYWMVPEGSHKEARIQRDDVLFIQFEKQATGGASSNTSGSAQGVSTSLVLVSSTEWEDTGVDVVGGQKIWFTISGQEMYSCGPDAPRVNADGKDPLVRDNRRPIADSKFCALIGRIGKNGRPFRIGLNLTPFTADAPGRLFVEVNDYDFRDNVGKLSVYIKTGDMN